jgi:hypothetical protein
MLSQSPLTETVRTGREAQEAHTHHNTAQSHTTACFFFQPQKRESECFSFLCNEFMQKQREPTQRYVSLLAALLLVLSAAAATSDEAVIQVKGNMTHVHTNASRPILSTIWLIRGDDLVGVDLSIEPAVGGSVLLGAQNISDLFNSFGMSLHFHALYFFKVKFLTPFERDCSEYECSGNSTACDSSSTLDKYQQRWIHDDVSTTTDLSAVGCDFNAPLQNCFSVPSALDRTIDYRCLVQSNILLISHQL